VALQKFDTGLQKCFENLTMSNILRFVYFLNKYDLNILLILSTSLALYVQFITFAYVNFIIVGILKEKVESQNKLKISLVNFII